jgi:hypothetical protein
MSLAGLRSPGNSGLSGSQIAVRLKEVSKQTARKLDSKTRKKSASLGQGDSPRSFQFLKDRMRLDAVRDLVLLRIRQGSSPWAR